MKKFIAGVVTGLCVIPVLEELTNLALAWVESAKVAPSKRTLKGSKEMAEIQGGEEISTQVIGFQYSPEEEDEDCYEDE